MCPSNSESLPIIAWGDHVDRDNRVIDTNPIINPFTVVIDTREQHPYTFNGFTEDSAKKYRPLVIHTTVRGLLSGDYAIEGLELYMAVERKSLADAFATFTTDRDRFERELDRLNQMPFAAVVIEAGWEAIFRGPMRPDRSEEQSRLIGKTCYRSILAWSQRFPRVHWFPMPDRLSAERTTFRLLQRFHKDWTDKAKAEQRKSQRGAIDAED